MRPTKLSSLIVIGALLSFINEPIDGHGSKKQTLDLDELTWDREKCASIDGFEAVKHQIWQVRPKLDAMFDMVLNGNERHTTYDELALFVDTFGPRISGSDSLERAIDYMLDKAANTSKLDNVHPERAMIPKWVRGYEYAQIVTPVAHNMSIMGLGTSVGTGAAGITAEAVVVSSFEQLDELGPRGAIQGKIVVYNHKFTTYGATVGYRSQGASRASRYGAVATLVRSITPASIYSPHAGGQSYASDVKVKIPTAAITLEDADLIERWIGRNKSVTLHLYMEAQNYPPVESRNIVAEIKGHNDNKNEEIVLVSGHMDSWDVTQGAMDDGGGMMISYKALDLLRKAGLRPQRTVRALLWTSEEFGYVGAQQYLKDHRGELDKFSVVMESDLGTFNPLGLSMTGSTALGKCIVHEVTRTLGRINATKMDLDFEGSDIELFTELGVPGVSLKNDNAKYFNYHHTRGDSMSLEDPDELDRAALVWASAAYILADIDIILPRKDKEANVYHEQPAHVTQNYFDVLLFDALRSHLPEPRRSYRTDNRI